MRALKMRTGDTSIARNLCYSLPNVSYGFMYMMFAMYYMKFATDVLYIAPALIGSAFGLARLWDAFVDPVVGYWSDRTHHRLGRRRPWLLFGAIPIGGSFVMAFAPPEALGRGALSTWVVAAVFAFNTAISLFVVPHMSLGAELSEGGCERNRIFGYRYAALAVGYVAGLGAIALLLHFEGAGAAGARPLALKMSVLAAAAMAACLMVTVLTIREPRGAGERVHSGAILVFWDVFRNPHARILLFVAFVEFAGGAVTGLMAFYLTQYVLKRPELGPAIILVWLVCSIAGVPLSLFLTRYFPRRRLWIIALLVGGLGYGSLFFVTEGAVVFVTIVMVLSGTASAFGSTFGPSTQSDVIDYDEMQSGERKEGTYFACWNFVAKAAGGSTVLLAGLVLQWSGFVPNAEQSEPVKIAIRAYMSLFPCALYLVGAWMLTRFSLNEAEHAAVRQALARRRGATVPIAQPLATPGSDAS
jgi:GPH family glycoside/pentoside/hexuronide:cation symporter